MASKYFELLKDPRWQRKRLEILERDKFQCRNCGDKSSTLVVHHRYYVSGRLPWEYPGVCYATLCNGCHDYFSHEYLSQMRAINIFPTDDWEIFLDKNFTELPDPNPDSDPSPYPEMKQ
jgi:hypothetical protein